MQLDLSRPQRFVDVGHAELAYWRIGEGPDLVFLHGWPLWSATFRDLAPLLATDFTCHLFDLPGAGHSRWDRNTPISITAHADTTARAVDAIRLESFALVGHDSGATIARYLAAEQPGRVTGLVMGNTEIPRDHAPPYRRLVAIGKSRLGPLLISAMLHWRTARRSGHGFRGCFVDRDRIEGDFFNLMVAPLVSDRRALSGQLRLLRSFEWGDVDRLEEVHAKLLAPTLLVWGAQDPFFPLEAARRMMPQLAGGAELVVLDPGKLLAHEEFPHAFANAARGFLKQCFVDRCRRAESRAG